MRSFKQCLVLTMWMLSSVTALAETLCGYLSSHDSKQLSDQILLVYQFNQTMFLITKDLFVHELDRHYAPDFYSNETATHLFYKWPKLANYPAFSEMFKNNDFKLTLFVETASFTRYYVNLVTDYRRDQVSVVSYFGFEKTNHDKEEEPKVINYKPDKELGDLFSKDAIWSEVYTILGQHYVFQPKQDNNYLVTLVMFAYFNRAFQIRSHSNYICKHSSGKNQTIMLSVNKCDIPWDDKVVKIFSGKITCFILTHKQVYSFLCEALNYANPYPLTSMSYNKLFNCGLLEEDTDHSSSYARPITTIVLNDQPGFFVSHMIAIIAITVVVIVVMILLLVLLYCLCCMKSSTQDKKHSRISNKGNSKGRAVASSIKGSSMAVGSSHKVNQFKGQSSR